MPIVEPKGGLTPPPARGKRTPAAPSKPSAGAEIRKDIRAKRAEGVVEFFGMLGGVSIGLGWWADAATYQMHGPTLADEAVRIADDNEKVGALLDKWAEIAPMGNLVTAVAMMGLQLAANHKLISAERAVMFGASDPIVLETEMKSRVQLQIMEQRKAAADKAREVAAMTRRMQADIDGNGDGSDDE